MHASMRLRILNEFFGKVFLCNFSMPKTHFLTTIGWAFSLRSIAQVYRQCFHKMSVCFLSQAHLRMLLIGLKSSQCSSLFKI